MLLDDIASSMWTIIESNIGIICTCLPCCRPILHLLSPFVFPSIEPNSSGGYNGSSSGSSGKFTKAGIDKDAWVPPSGSQDVQLSSVHATRNESGEHILHQGAEDAYEKISAQGIYKVTKFTVSYHEAEV
jgi:hypothetical protein